MVIHITQEDLTATYSSDRLPATVQVSCKIDYSDGKQKLVEDDPRVAFGVLLALQQMLDTYASKLLGTHRPEYIIDFLWGVDDVEKAMQIANRMHITSDQFTGTVSDDVVSGILSRKK